MKTKSIIKINLLTACLFMGKLAEGQKNGFAGDLAMVASPVVAAIPASYSESTSYRKVERASINAQFTNTTTGALFNPTDITAPYLFGSSEKLNSYSVDNWDSQNNINNYNGNGLRITATGNAFSQDAITYQSGLNGGGAGIAFGRGPSWDTFMSFYTNHINNGGTGNIIERMRLDQNGNLGIGTIHPHEKLTVNGTMVARKIKVSIQEEDYADYVFASNYKLRSLTSIRNFIKKYKHLPEVPSAEDVGRNGMDLGYGQVVLLKKIEELTLYVLQQQNQINKLRKRVAALSAYNK